MTFAAPGQEQGTYRFGVETADSVLKVRQANLWPERPLSHVRVPGDDTALHLGVRHTDELVGVASFFVDGSAAQLRKLAVDARHRGQGLGAALVLQGAAQMRDKNLGTLWCDARVTALPFYQNLGFDVVPGIFFKSGLPYQKATLALS
ncbi:GNAT family N-acetyltransferase [uncultured Tateyamaria sp.]|uniref:GNAT family N-acetyltransferase n=1 Tax=uncultured Tateyamaria sp. TaxID=455651 RepID=UPI002629E1C3|nr:GNAT family N-acetyltransferase [uncultured Tateyamaria sp.]